MARENREGGGRKGRREYYEKLLGEQEESALSVAAFAEMSGVSAASLYSWRRRLGRAAVRKRGATLVEVSVTDAEEHHDAERRMTVTTGKGMRIELTPEFDEGSLRRLLGVLDRC